MPISNTCVLTIRESSQSDAFMCANGVKKLSFCNKEEVTETLIKGLFEFELGKYMRVLCVCGDCLRVIS